MIDEQGTRYPRSPRIACQHLKHGEERREEVFKVFRLHFSKEVRPQDTVDARRDEENEKGVAHGVECRRHRHDQPIEVFAIDAAELPNHCPNQPSGMGNYPPGCKVSQQEYGVVRFRPWWSRAPAAENRRRPTPSFSKRLVHASDRLVAELGAVQEVHACFITRRLAEEHALETLNAFIQDSGSIDGGTKIHADLMAVVKLYDWLQLRPEGGNDILWQDMRLRRTLLIRREDSERHQPPQRKPEKDETNAQVDERQLCEALHRVRQGKFEIKQEATLRLRSSNVQGDEKASAIEARLNRLRHHVANTNTGLQDLNKMRIISGSARRATKATSQVET